MSRGFLSGKESEIEKLSDCIMERYEAMFGEWIEWMRERTGSMRTNLLMAGMVFGVAAIVLFNNGVLPLRDGDFLFFAFIGLLAALYRPGWVFLLLVMMLPFEAINVAPAGFGIALRPYQFLAALLTVSLMIRFVTRRSAFLLFRFRWFDVLPIVMVFGAFIASVNASHPSVAIKTAVILCSFLLLYYLGRYFVETREDIGKIWPFFVATTSVIIGYAVWQNIRFAINLPGFETMPGRPNATFTEADWLGGFLLLGWSFGLSALFSLLRKPELISLDGSVWSACVSTMKTILRKPIYWKIVSGLSVVAVALVLTVSRSAWVGAIAVLIIGKGLTYFFQRSWERRFADAAIFSGTGFVAIVCALIVVGTFHLTTFDIFGRVASTAGEQEITVACDTAVALPRTLQSMSQLTQNGCWHINLEDVSAETASGNFVMTVLRPDPNVSIRREIYAKTFEVIRDHPVLGIGWGSITSYLGTDSRPASNAGGVATAGTGAGLNSSNLFLEVWLGSGLVGLVAFCILWFGIAISAARNFWSTRDALSFFVLVSWVGLSVFNLFNAGALLGFFWMYLAVAAVVMSVQRAD